MRGNNRSGSILVFILAILMMLSVLCVRLMEETVQELKYVSQPYHRKELRMHAYSWLEATVGIMNQANIYRGQVGQAPFFNLYELYSDPVKYLQEQGITSARLFTSIDGESEDFISPINVNVSVRIENEKLPSNLSEKGLKALFAFMYSEITESLPDEDDGDPYWDSLKDWEDEDDEEREFGAEDSFYEDEESPYLTPGRPIRNFEEFRYLKGFGPSTISSFDYDIPLFYDEQGYERKEFKEFKENFSFHNKDKVFIEGGANNLPDYFLRFISGNDMTYDRIIQIKEDGEDSTSASEWRWHITYIKERLNELNITVGDLKTQDIDLIRVGITVSRGQSDFQLHAILKLIKSKANAKHAYPVSVLEIRENENLID